METLVVNLFAGPGVGKSTNMALTFGKLKTRGIGAEFVSEYAKDLVWEGRHHALSFQPYISGKQIYRIERVLGKVPVIITDSPILLSMIYGDPSEAFEKYLLEIFDSWDTFNIHLLRNDSVHPYVAAGRTQNTVTEAMEIDQKIKTTLDKHGIGYEDVPMLEGEETANLLVTMIEERLG